MSFKLPVDCSALESPLSSGEQADIMAALADFYDHICRCTYEIDPITLDTVSDLLLLLQKHASFRSHISGQLFYVRALGISKLVVEWAFYLPKVIYASLLYGVVSATNFPISYISVHYDLATYLILVHLLGVHKRQDLDHPSLVCLENRLEKSIKEDHIRLAVLCIKLAERLYDLNHVAGYARLADVEQMAYETLSIDVGLANKYLGSDIGRALKKAAKYALRISRAKGKNNQKDTDQDN